MSILFKPLFGFLFLLSLLSSAAGWLALSAEPLLLSHVQLSPKDIDRARSVIKENDPRQHLPGSRQTARVAERDLNLAANYLLQETAIGGAQIRLHPDFADAVLSVRLPHLPVLPYLNVSLEVRERDQELTIKRLQIGRLVIPPTFAAWVVQEGLKRLQGTPFELMRDSIQGVHINRRELAVDYLWQPQLIEQARDIVVQQQSPQALEAYHIYLQRLHSRGIGLRGELSEVLQPLFTLAQRRSTNQDPRDENRALLAILGAWASGAGMRQLVPDAQPLAPFNLTLRGRVDLAQHFLVSAAIAAQGDSHLANAVGLYKEVRDAQGGSGFSFSDLAADLAGSRFGSAASDQRRRAAKLQAAFESGIEEADIMPTIHGLRDGMTSAQFRDRFGHPNDPRYQDLITEIDRRLDACRLLRNL